MREYSLLWMQTGEDVTRHPHPPVWESSPKQGTEKQGVSLVTGKQVGEGVHQTFSWRLSLAVRSFHGGHRPLGGGDM